ncbi:MAG: glycosyltransferase, partial [Clostridia bacterium]|nr:glycosyltransferase [Clostridia bacterium]
MKVAQINVTCGRGSTGKIVVEVSRILNQNNIENKIFYASNVSDYPNGVKYATDKEIKWQALRSRIVGEYGFNSKRITKRLIKELEKFQPNVVQLHNLHGHNCNLEMLFAYFKEKNIKAFWSMHDCWAFTAYCPHFDMIGCDRWETGCYDCPQRKQYTWFFDKSKKLYAWKNQVFSGLDLTVITASEWLTELVKKSIFKDYPVKIIANGCDLSVFQPSESKFREKYGLENKFIVLGVAFDWGVKKGLDVFIELSKRLDENYKIILVGTNDAIDKQLPKNILSIHRTQNQKELAEIYSAADVFVNATREETFGLVNIEALACGT